MSDVRILFTLPIYRSHLHEVYIFFLLLITQIQSIWNRVRMMTRSYFLRVCSPLLNKQMYKTDDSCLNGDMKWNDDTLSVLKSVAGKYFDHMGNHHFLLLSAGMFHICQWSAVFNVVTYCTKTNTAGHACASQIALLLHSS